MYIHRHIHSKIQEEFKFVAILKQEEQSPSESTTSMGKIHGKLVERAACS